MEVERSSSPETWQVRIRDADGLNLGAGVLLGGRHVLTCAHVACPAGEPLTEIRVDLMAGAPHESAQVVEWFARDDDDPRDLALLELANPLPAHRTARLASYTEWHSRSLPEVAAFGHLASHRHGQHALLRPLGTGGPRRKWVELQELPGSVIERGFSGSGVACTRTGMVLGVVVETTIRDTHTWMIPVTTIVESFPRIADHVVDYPAVRLRRLHGKIADLLVLLRGSRRSVTEGGDFSHQHQQVLVGHPLLETGLTVLGRSDGVRDMAEIVDLERIVHAALAGYSPDGDRRAEPDADFNGDLDADLARGAGIRSCRFTGCRGRVEETGFCDTCYRSPDPARQQRGPVRVDVGSWECAGLVRLPRLAFAGPKLQADTAVSATGRHRTCKSCEGVLARSVAGQKPCTAGYCPRCRERFSFAPQLRRHTVLGNKYEILGFLGRGGFGSLYLAKDTQLPDDSPRVVIKALINQPEDESVLQAELHHLMTLKNEKLVRALDFVRHQDETGQSHGYIVMEHITGVTLDELEVLAEPLPTEPGGEPPPRIVEILAYGCEILEVFEDLHRRGLLYTDMHPGNVMRGETGIYIVDLGSVRQQEDQHSRPARNRGFAVSDAEARAGLSIGSDLYAVARTLKKLQEKIPRPEDEERYRFSLDSLELVLRRALREGEERGLRFPSAAEMSEQLGGVLREILSLHDHEPRSRPSAHFTASTELQDNGLGSPPALETWTDGAHDLVDFGRPLPKQFVRNLPPPIIDRSDQHAARLDVFSGNDPDELDGYRSVEARLLQCRKSLDRSEPRGARRHVDEAAQLSGPAERWRIDWHHGLIALFESEFALAREKFEAVRAMLPAEATPKIALGYCLENLDEREPAYRHYSPVWRRDGGPASTVFGMARLCLARGQRRKAVRVLDEVRKTSKHYGRAQVAAARAHLIDLDSSPPPTGADFAAAARHLANLRNDDSHRLGDDDYARLVTWVRERAYHWSLQHPADGLPRDGGDVFGHAPTPELLRTRLERSFAELAGQATARRAHDALLDTKNRYRPLTWW